MIESIELNNFKSHNSTILKDLPSMAVFVGRNNSGKSSILQAFAYHVYQLQDSPLFPIGQGEDIQNDPERETEIKIKVRDSPAVLVTRYSKSGLANLWDGTSTRDDQKRTITLLRQVKFLSHAREINRSFKYDVMPKNVGLAGEHTWNLLHHLKANDDPRYETILDWLKRCNMGVEKIGIPPVGPTMGQLLPETFGRKTNIIVQGSGVWSILPILTAGVLAKAGETLVFEEPESHLHRAAINSLLQFFGECTDRGVQIFVSAHSMDFLMSLGNQLEKKRLPKDTAIYVCRRNAEGFTEVTKEDPHIFRRITQVIKEELSRNDTKIEGFED